MSPSKEHKELVDTLVAYRGTLDQLLHDISSLPPNAQNPLTKDYHELTRNQQDVERRVNELGRELEVTPSRFSVERFNRFFKAKSLIRQLNQSVKELGSSISQLNAGVRLSQDAELQRIAQQVRERSGRLREAMDSDPDDNTVISGNSARAREPSFIPDFAMLAPPNWSRTLTLGNASTPNFNLRGVAGSQDPSQSLASLAPPPRRLPAIARSQSQDPHAFAASNFNLDHHSGILGATGMGGQFSLLQQDLPPTGSQSAHGQPTQRMGHRHGPSLGAFNNRRSSLQVSSHSSHSEGAGSIGDPRITRRHSASSEQSYSSNGPSVYPTSSRSGSGNQRSYAGSIYASSSIARSSISIARSLSQGVSARPH